MATLARSNARRIRHQWTPRRLVQLLPNAADGIFDVSYHDWARPGKRLEAAITDWPDL